MKIILSSDVSFLLKYGYDLTDIPKNQIKIGYIITASKGSQDKSFIENIKKTIRDTGYNLEEIDIEGKTKEELRYFFKDKNIIHVEGGNTFYLIRAIKNTGFAEILKELLDSGKVYIGTSAGAYIMCPTIEVADWNEGGRDRFGVVDFKALNYVPFVLKAHYTDDQELKIKEKIKSLNYPLRILRDGQGIIIEDGKCSFMGGEEVKL